MPRLAAAVLLALVSLPAVLSAEAARADGSMACTTEPPEHWLSRATIAERAMAAGYPDIRHVVVAGSCYEIEALTAHRRRAEVTMDPMTGDIVRASMHNLPAIDEEGLPAR
jgi:hypothetical protein